MADPTGPTPSNPCEERLQNFALAVKKDVESIKVALQSLVGDVSDGETVLSLLSDPSVVSDDDLRAVLVNDSTGPRVPLGLFKKNLGVLRGPVKISEKNNASEPVGSTINILPTLPSDESFLQLLRTGGISRVGDVDLLAAVRGALAYNYGLYDVPDRLVTTMEAHATALSKPCGQDFYKLRKLVTQRSYGDLFEALDVDGRFVSEKLKNEFLKRVNANLWSVLRVFHESLSSWYQSWMTMMGPNLMNTVAAKMSGVEIPTGIMQPPDTNTLYLQSEAVVDAINKTFAGHGIVVARALAWEAQKIREVLENPDLPVMVGASDREEMLKKLGLEVGADAVAMERSLGRYSLGVVNLAKVQGDPLEHSYLNALLQLGNNIPWSTLEKGSLGTPKRVKEEEVDSSRPFRGR